MINLISTLSQQLSEIRSLSSHVGTNLQRKISRFESDFLKLQEEVLILERSRFELARENSLLKEHTSPAVNELVRDLLVRAERKHPRIHPSVAKVR